MSSDTNTDSKAFTASCAVHFGLCGLFVLGALKFQKPEELPKPVFELISAPVPADLNAKTVTSPTDAPPLPKLVRIKNIPIEFAKPVPEEPTPTPPKTPDKTPDKPAPKDTPKTKSQQQSFDEFAKNNPHPKNTPKTTPSKSVPQIAYNIPGSKPGQMAAPKTGELNIPVSPSDINLYMSLLGQRIKQAWHKPPTYAEIECEIYFDITAGGLVTNSRLYKSSGDNAFDQSALEALRSISSGGRPPQGKALTGNIITFNTRD